MRLDQQRNVPPIELRPYQEPGYAHLMSMWNAGWGFNLFWDLRVGKTIATLKAIREAGNRVMIVTPNSVANVWVRHLNQMQAQFHNFDIVLLTRGNMLERRETIHKLVGQQHVIIIVNYPAYHLNHRVRVPDSDPIMYIEKPGFKDAIERWMKADTIIYEEAHQIKDRASEQSKLAHTLRSQKSTQFVLGLTGTPTGRYLEAYYSIYKGVEQRTFGTTWASFKNYYLEYGGFLGKQIVGYKNVQVMNERIAATSNTVTRAQAGIREPENEIIPIQFGSEARAQYNTLKKKSVADINGLDQQGRQVSHQVITDTVLNNLLRLQQMTSGFINVGTDPQHPQYVDISSEKLDAAVDLIRTLRSQDKKLTLYALFLHDLDRLGEALNIPREKQWRGDNKFNEWQLEGLIEDFEKERIPLLMCQLHAASMGQDFSAGDCAIYYSIGYSLIDFSQVYGRILNTNPFHQPVNYHLQVDDSSDEVLYDALMEGQDVARQCSDLTYARRLFNA